jgi:hypothetical protein
MSENRRVEMKDAHGMAIRAGHTEEVEAKNRFRISLGDYTCAVCVRYSERTLLPAPEVVASASGIGGSPGTAKIISREFRIS